MDEARRKELNEEYASAVKGKSQEETQHEWFKFLTILYKEDDDNQIFSELRSKARGAAGKLLTKHIMGTIKDKELYDEVRIIGQDQYASDLNKYGIAEIDIKDEDYLQFTSDMAIEVLQALKTREDTVTGTCYTMAMVWHRFVEKLHAMYNLPKVESMIETIGWQSPTERSVMENNDFEIKLTSKEKVAWKNKIR